MKTNTVDLNHLLNSSPNAKKSKTFHITDEKLPHWCCEMLVAFAFSLLKHKVTTLRVDRKKK